MEDEAPVQAPTDIAGVAIHLSYMRRDILTMSKTLQNITSNFVPISTYLENKNEVDTRLKTLEKDNQALNTWVNTWSGRVWGINTTIVAVMGIIILLINHFWK